MALELFKPFVMRKLVKDGHAHNIKSAKRMVEKVRPEVWDVVEDVIKDHPVLLNRAPTLHRLGIQAFEPVLVEGKAIKIHPLVCSAYNADFDGDQMAVHVPLSAEAQAEARILMLSANNLLNPKDGNPVVTADSGYGSGHLLPDHRKDGAKGEGCFYLSPYEAMLAYYQGHIELQARIVVDITDLAKSNLYPDKKEKKFLITTAGKLIFNDIFPEDFPYINHTDMDKPLQDGYCSFRKECSPVRLWERLPGLSPNKPLKKNFMGRLIALCYRKYGNTKTAEILDNIKELGFRYATIAGITIGIDDIVVPPTKTNILSEADKKVEEIEKQCGKGFITADERYDRVISIWQKPKIRFRQT